MKTIKELVAKIVGEKASLITVDARVIHTEDLGAQLGTIYSNAETPPALAKKHIERLKNERR